MGKFVLIGGGARSGKSGFALARALALPPRRVFLATAQAFDDEMALRIRRHQAERQDAFDTIEEPLELPDAIARANAPEVILIDCLTLWLSNLLLRGDDEASVRRAVEHLTSAMTKRDPRTTILLVTNEVGMGIVPQTPLGRVFRDVAGWAHQRLTAEADEVHFAAMGMMLRLHPGPVEVSRPPWGGPAR